MSLNKWREDGLITRRDFVRVGGGAGLALLTADAPPEWIGADKSKGAGTWRIGNGGLERTLAFDTASGLVTKQLVWTAGDWEYISPSKPSSRTDGEFSFRWNDKTVEGRDAGFELVNVEQGGEGPRQFLNIHLHSPEHGFDVVVSYESFADHPATRKYLRIRNRGAKLARLSSLTVEALALGVGPENESILNAHYGATPRELLYTGRVEDAALLVENSIHGTGFAVISAIPGAMKRTDINGLRDPEHVHINVRYDTDLIPFERFLQPGEEFKTGAVSLVAYRRTDAFSHPNWVLPSYAAHLQRKKLPQGAPWVYNTWEPFRRDINEELILKLVDQAGKMGLDIFTIDDGWGRTYGGNEVNRTLFPRGLEPVQEAVERNGMRFGLWVSLATVSLSSDVYRAHPEWAATDIDGKSKGTSTAAGPRAVMCMATPYQDEAAARLIELIRKYNLGYVKLDLTTMFNAYGEAPGCWAKGHYHHTWAESLGMIYEGIGNLTRQVYEQHPGVLLDLTFELWGQKHLIDAGLLAAGDLDWLSNVNDRTPLSAGPRQARHLLYRRALSMPAESMLIGNLHAALPNVEEVFGTAIGSCPLLLGDLTQLSQSQVDWYRKHISWFKKLRTRVPMNSSFFPVGNWLQPSAAHWDGYVRLARDGSGMMSLFRNESSDREANIQLPYVPPGRYKLHSVIRQADIATVDHNDWLKGVRIDLPEKHMIDAIEITRLA